MERFYSQHGEDYLVWIGLGRPSKPGYYVEVGALDGKRYSNTYAFERANWRGVCIEAHPDFVEHTRNNRPHSTVVHAAVSDSDQDSITFHTNARGSLSAVEPLDETFLKDRFGDYFHGYEPVEVPAKSLTTILDDANAPREIDFMSVDVEGHEMPVLRGLDFDRYRPRILMPEAMEADAAMEIINYLEPLGYRLARRHAGNLFFCLRRADALRIRCAHVDVPLIHTAHPIDEDTTGRVIPPAEDPRRGVKGFVKRMIAA